MKYISLFALLVFLLAGCVPLIEPETTPAPVVQPVLYVVAQGNQVRLQYDDDSRASIDVPVFIREMTMDEFKQSQPAENIAVYADGHDQVAYLWVTGGETFCTQDTQANLDFYNFGTFYEITLPKANWWSSQLDAILLSKAMDQYLDVPNGGLCVIASE